MELELLDDDELLLELDDVLDELLEKLLELELELVLELLDELLLVDVELLIVLLEHPHGVSRTKFPESILIMVPSLAPR